MSGPGSVPPLKKLPSGIEPYESDAQHPPIHHRMKPHEILSLNVTASPQSLPWIQAMTQLQRAAQIEAALPPHLGVREAGFWFRISNNL